MKKIHFGFPKRAEVILLVLLIITMLFIDVNQNKVVDKGLSYATTWFGGYTSLAITNFWIGIFIYFFLFLGLMIIALNSRKTHYIYDSIISMLAVFGLSFIVGGFLGEWHQVTIPFLHFLIPSIDFYHVGIALTVGMPLVLAATD